MLLRTFLTTEPPCLSYLFGCGGHALGAVVDPVGPVEPYLRSAESLGLRIRYVVDTHLHADHRSCGRALAAEAGAAYVLHRDADVGFSFHGVTNGDLLSLGNVTAEAIHTPGHTPEHICLAVTDRTRGEDPWLVFTGHTLMVGDMGRTELAANAEEGARALFNSAERLRGLPDYVEVLPGAFAGSVCGRRLSGKPQSTIGFERRYNAAFGIEDETAFVEAMARDIPPPPPGSEELRAENAGFSPAAKTISQPCR